MPERARNNTMAKLALGAALLALFISLLGNLTVAVTSDRARHDLAADSSANRAYTCTQINELKDITKQALEAAITRAQGALPDEAAKASIAELQREIALLEKPCAPSSDG